MLLYILNSDTEVIGTLTSTGTTNKVTPFFDDEFLQDLGTGAETFSFSTFAKSPQAEALQVGNYVAFRYKEEYKLFQIIDTDETHNRDFVKSVYCEMAGIELINEIVRPMVFNSANVKQFASRILADTGWTLGYVDSRVADVHTIDLTNYTNAYQALQTHVVGTFKAELSFTVDIQGGHVVSKTVNIFSERGDFEGFRFDYDKNLGEVSKHVDSSELVTALIGVGKNNITFKNVSAPDKPINQDFIADEEAYFQWNKNGSHIMGVYQTNSTESPEELLKLTRAELQRRKTPKITYSLKVALVDPNLSIGDTVYVVDNEFTPALHLSARVSKQKISFTNSQQNECTLANFKEVVSKITDADRLIASIIDEKFPIGSSDISNGAISGDKLQDGAVNRPTIIQKDTIITEHIQTDTILAEHIKTDQIHTQHISAGSVKAGHIDAEQIEAQHIKADQIESGHIKAEAIESTHIKAESITADHLSANSIESTHIRADQIVSEHILAGQINADHLSANSVTTESLQAGSVSAEKLQAGSITADKLQAGSVTADAIEAGAITTDKLQANSIDTEKLQADSVTAEKIMAGEIKADHIASESIKTEHLTAESVSADHLQANSVTADKVQAEAIESKHIKSGSIEASHLVAGEIISDKAQIGQGVIQSAHIGDAQISTAHIGEAQITSAHIIDGAISSAKIDNAAIQSAHIGTAQIETAHIKEVNASKINSGTINTGLVEVSGVNGRLKIRDNRLQVFDASETPVERVSVGDVNGDGSQYGLRVRGTDGTTILYDENGVYSEGITDGAITNPKIEENAIDSRTLNLDELFVSGSAFVENLTAVELRAEQITTGKISSERIDISGLVTFESLSQDLSNSFIVPEGSDKTFINGGNIMTGTVTAEQMNVKGLTVTDSNNAPTFTIDNEGEVSISGEVISSNFSDVEGSEAGYKISKNGDAVFNQATLRGSVMLENAGITNNGLGADAVRFWAGTDFENRENAPFIVYQNGKIKASIGEFGGTFSGSLDIGNIHIKDTNDSEASFKINTNNDATTVIELTDSFATIDTDTNLAGLLKVNKLARKTELKGSFQMASDLGKEGLFMNVKDSNNYVVLNSFNAETGKHSFLYQAGQGGLTFQSEGSNDIVGQSYKSDFTFKRASGVAEVRVEGELTVTNKIKMEATNKIEMVSMNTAGNSGIDFIIR